VQVLRKIGEIVERCFQALKASSLSSNSPVQPELQSIIYELLSQLLLRLVDGTMEIFGADSAEMQRFFNSTTLSILEHGPKTTILTVCIRLLRESCIELSPSFANYNSSTAETASKVANLVLRCLWKTTKAIPSCERSEIDPERVLGEICIFYQNLPSTEWRSRASSLGAGALEVPHGDVPHRTVKAIIVELFKVFGEHLFAFTKTPEMEYIRFQLVALRDDFNSTAAGQEPSTHSTPSKDRENPFKIQLTSIFSRLISKSEYPQAIQDLYQFVRKDHLGNPLVESLFNEQLARCSSIFQRHVKSQLEKMSIEESVVAAVSFNEMQIDSVPAKGQEESSTFPKAESSSNSLDPYQEKLDRFKEILGISTRSSSSNQPNSKMTLKIESAHLEMENTASQQQESVPTNHSTVSSLKERLLKLKSMQNSATQEPNSKMLRND
jgi:hypothetical protein